MRTTATTAIAFLLTLLFVVPLAWGADKEREEVPKILGRTTVEALREEPFSDWFVENYDAYEPNPDLVGKLRAARSEDAELTVFFGTWCPDSRREVPRMIKLLDAIDFGRDKLTLVAVDRTDEANKQSPGGEEKGREIYRVPTMIVSRGGAEVARLVEHPVLSTERDLLAILSGEPYQLNFPAYPVIQGWLDEGLLADPNISPQGLAGLVQSEIRSQWDLIGAGRVLLSRGQVAEAVTLHKVNCALYRQNSHAFQELAKALHKAGKADEAREAAERALNLHTDPEQVAELVKLLDGGEDQD
jgi:tetratricopeptide (TPR) repeat protein